MSTETEVARTGRERVSQDFRRQLEGYGLTTAEIFYWLPDHPLLLQSYVWQEYDLWPDFPTLKKFLRFWQTELEGPLFAVTVAHAKLIKPAEIRTATGDFAIN
ncbi:MAG TPA: usg protein [Xanthobacteraceae bacterium]|nr:usg protein [Xanthobacteraceae bacterium]